MLVHKECNPHKENKLQAYLDKQLVLELIV